MENKKDYIDLSVAEALWRESEGSNPGGRFWRPVLCH